MASTIGKVRAVFTASTSGLTSGVNSASASMKSMAAQVSSLRSGMNSLVAIQGAQLFGSIVSQVGSAVSSLVRMGQAEAEVIDSTSKMAARLGMTYGELAGLAYAGSLADVSMETLAGAATRADVAFVKASQGSSVAAGAFSSLGLSVAELNGMSSAERFDAIATAISKLPTAAEKSAAAVKLFGRAGAQLMPLFSDGAAGIAAARKEAEAFGLSLTNVQGTNVEAMNDAFTRAQKAVSGVVQQVVAYLAPAVQSVTDAFSTFVAGVGGASIGQAIGDAILQGAVFFAGVADYFVTNGKALWDYVSSVGVSWSGVWEAGNRVASFFSGVFNIAKAVLGSLILGLTKPLEGLVVIAQKIGSYLGFDTSTIDALVAGAKGFNESITNDVNAAGKQAEKDFAVAFGAAKPALTAATAESAGFFKTTIEESIGRARDAAKQKDEAARQAIKVTQTVDVSPIVKGIDSRSREGVSEMFRLMRGGGGDVAEQQLEVQRQIAGGIQQLVEGEGVAEFAF
jgi:hypothetical protein